MIDSLIRRTSVLTVEQVASQLRVSRSLVYSLIEAGKLKCHRIGIGRGTIRLSQADLESFLRNCRRDNAAVSTGAKSDEQ
ncbi:helix-turn-helix domain-containing protein [Aporhodopirellula aestuarii]|uniref:helix-turn-helix domain-containing protein n=1 Tax=Aporhodopirellula aestuarii TaxID=2950107 RepID=UPI0038990764